ncbi:MAG: flavin reductase family protein [Solirubrobacterales bacterium]
MSKQEIAVEELFGLTYWPPVPATLVSTLHDDGTPNVAPFSLVCFAGYSNVEEWDQTRKGLMLALGDYESSEAIKTKATYKNIARDGEFVVNIPSSSLVLELITGTARQKGQDKVVFAGLTPEPSSVVGPPGVKECSISYECRKLSIQDLGMGHEIVWGELVGAGVEKGLLEADDHIERMKMIDPIFHYAYDEENGTFYGLGPVLREENPHRD